MQNENHPGDSGIRGMESALQKKKKKVQKGYSSVCQRNIMIIFIKIIFMRHSQIEERKWGEDLKETMRGYLAVTNGYGMDCAHLKLLH